MAALPFHPLLSLLAIAGYALASALLIRPILQRRPPPRRLVWMAGLAAVALHGVDALTAILTAQGVDLGFFRVSSLIFWMICVIALGASLRRPLDTMLACLFPLAAVVVATALLVPGPSVPLSRTSPGMAAHVLLSILAYSLLTLAALQALTLALLQYRLKHHQLRGIIQVLPPLQTMESMLFELIWVGVILLSLSIVTGFVYIDNLFAQHLAHKTVLSIAAWVFFVVLLTGHHALGWRSYTAVRWTLAGFALLMLGYFGSKLVLELILHQPMG